MIRTRTLALLLLIGLLLGLAAFALAQAGGDLHTFVYDGLTRTYRLFVPPAIAAGDQSPLVIALHGGGGTAENMARLSDFDTLAAVEGFFVVYPEGVDGGWNDGRLPTAPTARDRLLVDDVAFIAALIAHLAEHYPIDLDRVYATGISNGGAMALRLACDLSDPIAAIAAVTANLPTTLDCAPEAPVSVLVINGTADPLVPFEGGDVAGGGRGSMVSTAETMQFWAEYAGCDPEPAVVDVPDSRRLDGTRTRLASYLNCRDGMRLVLAAVTGGGHTWPGGPQYLPILVIGRTSRDFSATAYIWAFFDGETLPLP